MKVALFPMRRYDVTLRSPTRLATDFYEIEAKYKAALSKAIYWQENYTHRDYYERIRASIKDAREAIDAMERFLNSENIV